MKIAFAPLASADIAAVAALWHEGWHAGHAGVVPERLTRLRRLDDFHDRLARHLGQTRVARIGPEIIGFVILHGDELYQFYLARGARGTGAAALLMAEAEARLRATGVRRAWLACTVGNTRAARFYEKSGWLRAATETMSFETADGPFPLEVWRYEKAL